MYAENFKRRFAWEPLTPPGVAAFAGASCLRLWLVQFFFAVFAAAIVSWFLDQAWFPTVSEAIRALPAQGEIREGKLNWPGNAPRVLAEGHFLAFIVDPDHEGQLRSAAHIQLEFGRNDIYVFSLLGYLDVPYPAEYIFLFNRTELEPKWGAWRPPILWLSFAATLAGLMASWALLAAVYLPLVMLVGFFTNKDLKLSAAWKLAGAALMPGALLLTVAIIFYGLGVLDLVQFSAAFIAHFVIGWVYLIVVPLFTPKLATTETVPLNKNPFAGSTK